MRRCLVRAMYLSAFLVAMSTWGAVSSVRPLPFLKRDVINNDDDEGANAASMLSSCYVTGISISTAGR